MLRLLLATLFYLLHVTSGMQNFFGVDVKNPKDPEYKQLAEESLEKYLNDTHNKLHYKVDSVNHVTVEVVEGFMTRLDFTISPIDILGVNLQCHSEIWEKDWVNFKNITVQCHQNNAVGKRENVGILPGGIMVVDPKDPKYRQLAEESLEKYLKDTHTNVHYKVLSVNHASIQVVEGFMTRLDFTISHIDILGVNLQCHSEIWEKDWVNFKNITVQCHQNNAVGKRENVGILPGGIMVVDPKDPKYRQLAEESLEKYLKDTHTNVHYKVLSVNHASVQVVEGFMTRLDFTISPIDILGVNLQCHSEIWEKDWVNFKDIKVQCHQNNAVGKRENVGILPGGIMVVDPKDPKYRQLAEESLEKYLKDTHTNVHYKVLSVNHASIQVVEGFMTRLDFTISPIDILGVNLQCHSEIWEKDWVNFKNITVQCHQNNAVGKRENVGILPGGITVVDPKDPKYRQLAEESLEKYLKDTHTNVHYKVLSVNHASIQVVEGFMTRLDFTISHIDILGVNLQCHSEIWEKDWVNFKNITVQCHQNNAVGKRENVGILPGGIMVVDPKDPKYRQLAEESLEKYLKDTHTNVHYKVLSVNHASIQVVEGFMTRLDFTISHIDILGVNLQCHSEIWEKDWVNFKNITVQCHQNNAVGKRENVGILPGGIMVVDPKDPKYRQLAEESLEKYLKDTHTNVHYKVLSVNHASIQVVEGFMTRLDFTISPIDILGVNLQCHSEIWEKDWVNFKNITVQCHQNNAVGKRENVGILPGGIMVVDPKDPKYRQLAEESLEKYLKDTHTNVHYKVLSVNHASIQVVEGFMTRLDFTISPIDILGVNLQCHSEIWEKDWVNFKNITVQCHQNNAVGKRENVGIFPGGIMVVDPKDPKYRQLAEESLEKYLKDTHNNMQYKVLSVNHASIQVVAGSLTRIDFRIIPDMGYVGDILKCHSEIWERPWEQFKNIRVYCLEDYQAEFGKKI